MIKDTGFYFIQEYFTCIHKRKYKVTQNTVIIAEWNWHEWMQAFSRTGPHWGSLLHLRLISGWWHLLRLVHVLHKHEWCWTFTSLTSTNTQGSCETRENKWKTLWQPWFPPRSNKLEMSRSLLCFFSPWPLSFQLFFFFVKVRLTKRRRSRFSSLKW